MAMTSQPANPVRTPLYYQTDISQGWKKLRTMY